MVYYTGDIHGDPAPILTFCHFVEPTVEDIIVILGDVGANYYGQHSRRDNHIKQVLNNLGPTILCVHGNHEMRPATIPSYEFKEWNGGVVWYERAY